MLFLVTLKLRIVTVYLSLLLLDSLIMPLVVVYAS